jgi:heat-inducible transcriptional repressor
MITELNERSREIFRQLVDTYLETGEPIGSRTLSRKLSVDLSPATIRNVMSDLEDAGLLFAPHTSAGRLPTEAGLRIFVDGILEIGNLAGEDRRALSEQFAGSGGSLEDMLDRASAALSGLSRCAGLVMAPKTDYPLKHIELVSLSPGRAMVVMVTETGIVENRIIETPPDLPPSALIEASNYLTARTVGQTLHEARDKIIAELEADRTQLDQLTSKVVESGLATWGDDPARSLIVRGQSHLLDDVQAIGDLERIRNLFTALDTKDTMLKVLSMVDEAEGVQIFIGSSNTLFNLAGCSMIVSSYRDSRDQIVGALGVIGPTRINYARIIPMVDYTAKLLSKVIG